ncbi:hypothetical protein [Bacillus cereus]|nr:hypothetical protein [Bacillus cereus]MDM5039908.1 hypothetical protein [Bacillus sp. OR-18]
MSKEQTAVTVIASICIHHLTKLVVLPIRRAFFVYSYYNPTWL